MSYASPCRSTDLHVSPRGEAKSAWGTRPESRNTCLPPACRRGRDRQEKRCILVLKPFSLFFRSGLRSMSTARRESCLACITKWRSDVCVDPESRDPNHETRLFGFTVRKTFLLERTSPPPMVFTNHETRDTKHGFSRDTNHGLYRRAVRRGCDRFAQPTAAARAAAPVAQSLLSCSLLFAIVRHCSLINIALSQCPRTVCRSRQSSRRASFAAAPVALRAAAVAAIARWTHPEKGQRSGSHEQGSFLYCVGRKKGLTIGESQSTIRQHICTYAA